MPSRRAYRTAKQNTPTRIAMTSPGTAPTLGRGAFRPHQDAGASHADFVKTPAAPSRWCVVDTLREIEIAGDTIRLGQLLKLAGIARSGGEAKLLLADRVRVNGAGESRRGRQLQRGDVVEADGEAVRVT